MKGWGEGQIGVEYHPLGETDEQMDRKGFEHTGNFDTVPWAHHIYQRIVGELEERTFGGRETKEGEGRRERGQG